MNGGGEDYPVKRVPESLGKHDGGSGGKRESRENGTRIKLSKRGKET
jgi:hypothetical protein